MKTEFPNLITDFSDFEVKSLKGTIMPFKTDKVAGHYVFDQFGLFHNPTKSWVSLGSTCIHTNSPIPTQYKKSVWRDVMKSGIIPDSSLGYYLINTDELTTK